MMTPVAIQRLEQLASGRVRVAADAGHPFRQLRHVFPVRA